MAVAFLLMFDCYLRPYELLGLRFCDFLRPVAGFSCISLLICPWEVGVPSKTKVFDDAVPLDSKDRTVVHKLAQRLLAQASPSSTQRVFRFSHADMLLVFKEAMAFVYLDPFQFVLYSARHGGPSADRASGLRSIADIQKRGRWQSFSSGARYEQTGRLQLVCFRVPAEVWQLCVACRDHLEEFLLFPRKLLRPRAPARVVAPAPPPLVLG